MNSSELTNRAALARNLDFLAIDDASIPILTVHPSKGLELEIVADILRNMP